MLIATYQVTVDFLTSQSFLFTSVRLYNLSLQYPYAYCIFIDSKCDCYTLIGECLYLENLLGGIYNFQQSNLIGQIVTTMVQDTTESLDCSCT